MTLKPVRKKVLAGYLRELKKAAKTTPVKRKRAVTAKSAKKTTKKKNQTPRPIGEKSLEKSIVRLSKDSDRDGLSDYQEYLYGTNPHDPDTDHDSLSDFEEIKLFQTNPHDPDTNKNGLTDGEDVRRGNDPRGQGLLKDLFIPHPGNDFRPGFLKPHRLAWYSLTAVVIKAVVIFTFAVIPLSAWLTPDINDEQAQKIVALTNDIRSSLKLNKLTTNVRLAGAAANKAKDMAINQYFSHTSPRGQTLSYWLRNVNYGYDAAGENLAMGFSDAGQVVNAWTKSRTHYANIIDPDYQEIGVALTSGSYQDKNTTFVVQLFGSPRIAVATNSRPTKYPDITASLPKINTDLILKKSMPIKKVLGEKTILAPLERPSLVFPEAGSILKDTELKLKIVAPEAENVRVFDKDHLVDSSFKNADGYFEGTINLGEGRHELIIESVRGGESATSSGYQLEIDQTAPVVDQKQTKIVVSTPPNRNEKAVSIIAYLSPDTARAEVNFGNFNLALSQDNNDPTKWAASALIFSEDEEQIFNPVTLANISATDRVGNNSVTDINWENITPLRPSVMTQYFYAKNLRKGYTDWMFHLSEIYFQLLLVLIIGVMALNVIIRFKKGCPIKKKCYRTMVYTTGLVVLLIILVAI